MPNTVPGSLHRVGCEAHPSHADWNVERQAALQTACEIERVQSKTDDETRRKVTKERTRELRKGEDRSIETSYRVKRLKHEL
jgi:hypothetical protein